MKKIVLIIALLTLYLPVQSQNIPGLIDTLWLEYPNNAVVYSISTIFSPNGDKFAAEYAGYEGKFAVDSINLGTISIIDSDTGILLDTLFSDSLESKTGMIKFFPNSDSLLIDKKYYESSDSILRLCIYDLNTKQIVNVIRPEYPMIDINLGVNGALLTNSGDSLFISNTVQNIANHDLYHNFFQIWDLNTNSLLMYEQCDHSGMGSFSPTGQLMTVSSSAKNDSSYVNLLYLDSLSNGYCDNWVSIYDSTSLVSKEGKGAIFSPSGRFLAVGTGEYIYDVLNQEPYLSWDIDAHVPPHNRFFNEEMQFFIDDRFILYEVRRKDTLNDIQYFEWWVFDIETSQFVHKEDQRQVEQLRYYSTYDPVGNRMIYHGQDNRARMYKINVEKLYENVSVEETIEPRNASEISIYPNPAEDYIEILGPINPTVNRRVDGSVSEEIEIYNVLGEKVIDLSSAGGGSKSFQGFDAKVAGGGQIRIDVSHLPIGMYFIKIGDKFEKFVKE